MPSAAQKVLDLQHNFISQNISTWFSTINWERWFTTLQSRKCPNNFAITKRRDFRTISQVHPFHPNVHENLKGTKPHPKTRQCNCKLNWTAYAQKKLIQICKENHRKYVLDVQDLKASLSLHFHSMTQLSDGCQFFSDTAVVFLYNNLPKLFLLWRFPDSPFLIPHCTSVLPFSVMPVEPFGFLLDSQCPIMNLHTQTSNPLWNTLLCKRPTLQANAPRQAAH